MSTNENDVAYDRVMSGRGGSAGPRVRRHESSAHVRGAISAWLMRNETGGMRIHPQALFASETPIGSFALIYCQSARTPIESSVRQAFELANSRVDLIGVPVAIALPDLPRLRRTVAQYLEAVPGLLVTWLFVSRWGDVAVQPPRGREPQARRPEPGPDQSSTRSDTAA